MLLISYLLNLFMHCYDALLFDNVNLDLDIINESLSYWINFLSLIIVSINIINWYSTILIRYLLLMIFCFSIIQINPFTIVVLTIARHIGMVSVYSWIAKSNQNVAILLLILSLINIVVNATSFN